MTGEPTSADAAVGIEPISSIRFPAYDMADRRFRQKAFEAVRRAEPLLGQIDLVDSDHAGPIRSVGGEKPFDSPMKMHSGLASIAVVDIENMRFEAYADMVRRTTDELIEAFAKTFFGEMGALTEHVGNVVDGKGKSLVEQFKEGLMKVGLDFDDDGSLIPKQLIVHPDKKEEAQAAMEQVLSDPEVHAHVIAEREKFLAAKGQRRLLSPC